MRREELERKLAAAPVPAIVAHRGGAALQPENTTTAFRHAASLHVDAIECDVHASKDGEVIVIHDPTLERTHGVSGIVREMTAAELRVLPLSGTEGEVVPLLGELLDLVAPTRLRLSLEIKTDVDNTGYEGIEHKILDLLTETQMRDRTIVHAFDFAFIAQFAKLAPDIMLGANVGSETMERFENFDALLDEIVAMDCHMLNIDHRLLDEDRLMRARDRGLSVTVWTVNDHDAILRWLRAGVDYITTDHPDVALQLRA